MSSRWLGQVGCFGPCTKLSPCKVWSSGRLSLLCPIFIWIPCLGGDFPAKNMKGTMWFHVKIMLRSQKEKQDYNHTCCWDYSNSNLNPRLFILIYHQSRKCFMGRRNTWNPCRKGILSLAATYLCGFPEREKCLGTKYVGTSLYQMWDFHRVLWTLERLPHGSLESRRGTELLLPSRGWWWWL